MRVLLVEPPKAAATIGGDDVFLFEPLALEYLGGGLADHHDVRILDMRLEDDLDRVVAGFRPDVVGLTAYTVHVKTVRRLAAVVKANAPDVLTVVGGHHATVAPADFTNGMFDLVVRGDGVVPFREIVRRHEKRLPFTGIAGVAVSSEVGAEVPEQVRCSDLDADPLPDRSLTTSYRGSYYCDWMKPLASIRTSRGCPFRCSFCAQWKVAGGRYVTRTPERIVEELAGIDEECVFFADDESLVDARRMRRLAELILREGIRKRIFLYGRSDTIAANPDLLEIWREVGLERVFIGLEFAHDDDLAYIRKTSTANDNERAVRILQSLGIDVYASFIVRPEFERGDFEGLRRYCRRLGLDYASFAVLTPLPGTDLSEQVGDRIMADDSDLFDFLHTLLPTSLPLPEFYAELARLYERAIPVRRQLALLHRYPIRDLPGLVRKRQRVLKSLRSAWKDHPHESR